MSLKDRLGTQTKATLKIEKTEPPVKYYNTSEASESIDSLGEIDTLFSDDDISSISVYGAKNIFIERKGKRNKIALQYRDDIRLENVIKKNLKYQGIEPDETHPFVNFSYRQGINISATLPPLSNVPTMFIKCYKDKFGNIKSLIDNLALSKEIALIIEALAGLKLNIIIAGKKNTLKTTLLSAIAKKVPQNESGVIFDYSNEIKSENNNVIAYDFKNYENKNLIEDVILTEPDKVFLNDCKDIEYFDKFIESGFKGICATFCAESPYDVLKALYLQNSDVVIFVKREGEKRYIDSISLVKGSELENIFYFNEQKEYKSTGIVPDFYNSIEQTTLPISTAVFEAGYKHTYHVPPKNETLTNSIKKSLNPEILKKFKKETTENKADSNEQNV